MPTAEIDKTRLFAENLNTLRKNSGWSVGEMAKRAGVPKSTMQAALTSGHVTLDTAIRISEGLALPLDSLAGDVGFALKLDIARYLIQGTEWFQALSSSERDEATSHFRELLNLICR